MTHSINISRPPTTRGKPRVIGWDVGGANTKAVRLEPDLRAASEPLAMQRDAAALVPTLRRLAGELGAEPAMHAVTMTAELSQAFRTKREGVGYVLDAMAEAFPEETIRVYTSSGGFLDPAAAKTQPLEVAAANWHAAARFVGRKDPDCLLIDIGTTTTDIIPIVRGEPATLGRTDPERLMSGELLYTGAVRTPVESVTATVPLSAAHCPLVPEGFALMGDAYLWLGALHPEDYSVATPDGRPATREFAGERLARAVCADAELLDEAEVGAIAGALAEAQAERVAAALRRVRARHPALAIAVVTGLGDFVAAEAARRVGLEVRHLAERLGEAARTAPAAAVAWLLADSLAPA